MPNSTNPNRQWFQYTDDRGNTWAMKVQASWGNNADSGFVAYGGGGPAYGSDPVFPLKTSRNRPRAIIAELVATGIVQTTVGFRKTKARVGSNSAAAWTTPGYTFVSSAKGIAGAVDYQVVGYQEEHILVAHPITSLPEPTGP